MQNEIQNKMQSQSNQAIIYIDVNNADAMDTLPKQATHLLIKEVVDKQTLLASLAQAGEFPSYFAHNWDSAWDCLTDSNIEHLVLNLSEVNKINTEDFNVFKSLIADAYMDFGKPQLWVIVAGD